MTIKVGDSVRYVGPVSYLKGKTGKVTRIVSPRWMHVRFSNVNTTVVKTVNVEKET